MTKMDNLRRLKEVMLSSESLSYNDKGKQNYRRIGQKAMKELASLLQLNPYGINFNPGGIAVSGDLRLMGMCNDKKGVYIMMNKDVGLGVLYRSISHMKDYTGGRNNHLRFEDLDNEQKLKQMRSVCDGP